MASQTYAARGLVLRRTKLGETDVIVTLLSDEGTQIRAVAKGARKPTSSFASRLEVYCVCDVLLVRGKSLDIIKEARLVEPNSHLRSNLDALQAAAPMVELLDRATQVGSGDARLFAMSCAALTSLKDETQSLFLVTAAQLLKAVAILGLKPSFDTCVCCGKALDTQITNPQASRATQAFSLVEGGLVCASCWGSAEVITLDAQVISWGQSLLYSTFSDIVSMKANDSLIYDLLSFLRQWIRTHVGCDLKSLNLLFRTGPL